MLKMYVEERPWGNFTILEESDYYKVKRIVVNSGERLSYQFHYKREENWTIVQGEALVILNDKPVSLIAGQNIFIPKQAKHRISNPGTSDLVFIEVQTGSYFGEDDIVRLEDDYKRA